MDLVNLLTKSPQKPLTKNPQKRFNEFCPFTQIIKLKCGRGSPPLESNQPFKIYPPHKPHLTQFPMRSRVQMSALFGHFADAEAPPPFEQNFFT